ncbi:MAG: hypothetical protein IT376_02745 [Polyangiaceae bacterium]|nr:hypothetical protein [Polyangiaceae bacterium]
MPDPAKRPRDGAHWPAVLAVLGAAGVVLPPFAVVTYPPITDLPFHAAQSAIFLHFSDPAYRFAEQFSLHPLEAPYVVTYLVTAALGSVLPIRIAASITAALCLLAPAAGLAALLRGIGKSPLLATLAFGLVWNNLAHWGFLSFLLGLGLELASVGVALATARDPTRRRAASLAVLLVAVFFAHPFRFPFALAGVGLVTLLAAPASAARRQLAAAAATSAMPFLAWLLVRPAELSPPIELGWPDPSRVLDAPRHLFDGFRAGTDVGAEERSLALALAASLVVVIAAILIARRREPKRPPWPAARRGATVVAALVGAHALAYFVLPMKIGEWWYVYPRELLCAAVAALAWVPELPVWPKLRLAVVAVAIAASTRMTTLVTREWAGFERATEDFRAVVRAVPPAPRLAYLVFDHRGASQTHSPFVHLPAWVQAERGGWLSFHFATWGLYPVRYRAGGDVPPPLPLAFEWRPQDFRLLQLGWFDALLVRHTVEPAPIVAADPGLKLAAHEGTWWLYVRR